MQGATCPCSRPSRRRHRRTFAPLPDPVRPACSRHSRRFSPHQTFAPPPSLLSSSPDSTQQFAKRSIGGDPAAGAAALASHLLAPVAFTADNAFNQQPHIRRRSIRCTGAFLFDHVRNTAQCPCQPTVFIRGQWLLFLDGEDIPRQQLVDFSGLLDQIAFVGGQWFFDHCHPSGNWAPVRLMASAVASVTSWRTNSNRTPVSRICRARRSATSRTDE